MATNLATPQSAAARAGILLDVNETLFSIAGLRELFIALGARPGPGATLVHARAMRDGLALTAAGDFQRFADIAKSSFIALDPGRLGPAEASSVLDHASALEPYPDVAPGLQLIRACGRARDDADGR